MAAPPLLLLKDIRVEHGDPPLLDGAELSVAPGERLALVGRNGSGKSTLLKVAAGLARADGGTRFLQPGTTLRYLPQEPDLSGFATVRAYAEDGLGPADDAHRVQYLLERLGLSGDEEPGRLSGGEARRAAIARVLAPRPDILLLDEPTNHLDLPAIAWLEEELGAMRAAMVIISHDRRFLATLSRAMAWIDRGRTRRLEKGFAHFEAWHDEVIEQEEVEAHKLDRKVVREEHWLRHGVSARGSTLGPMAEVVYESLQHLTDADVAAMALYLKSLPVTAVPRAKGAMRVTERDLPRSREHGATLYGRHCASCHGDNGEGRLPAAPALAGNRALTMDSAVNPIRVLLFGGFPPGTPGNPRPFGMPPFNNTLNDQDVADLLTYLRSSWGNDARPISAAEVSRNRQGPLW